MIPVMALENARGHLLPLVSICLGIGIALWFGWPDDPGPGVLAGFALLALLGGIFAIWRDSVLHPPGLLLLALAIGFLAADMRAQVVQAPVLEFRYYGPIEGRIIEVDRSGSDMPRLTLDQVRLKDVGLEKTPKKVRVSLHGAQDWLDPVPGQVVMMTGHLSPPEGPPAPGAFDFQRMAFFAGLGAVGYTRTPVLLLEPPAGFAQWIDRLQMRLSAVVMAAIPGQAGAFASGMTTGDRSGISPDTVAALRDSSLSHILAISGLHMSLLCAFVFGLIRGVIALIPPLALRVDSKKLAALLSLGVALFFLLLSGSTVSTKRAFVMIAVVLVAVLLDRRAISLRSVAIAAMILLIWQPENLFSPGFQMSFAATIALISGFRALEGWLRPKGWSRWRLALFSLFATSLIGGFSTAPYAAAQFHRFADYGLLANMLTVPLMGVMIMPMAALAMILAPIGLAEIPLWIMGKGAAWILGVAHFTASLKGAVMGIMAPAPGVLMLMTLGALWLIAWPGKGRLAGLALALLALLAWPMASRPDLLISGDGRLAGLMGAEGRALSHGTRDDFTAMNWLEGDGDLVTREEAAARPGFAGPMAARQFTFAGQSLAILTGSSALSSLPKACDGHDLVIIDARVGAADRPAGCLILDQGILRQSGALALGLKEGQVSVTPTRSRARIWSGEAVDPGKLAAALPREWRIEGF